MQVSICLGAILIPEYLDFHSAGSRNSVIYSYCGISQTNAPLMWVMGHPDSNGLAVFKKYYCVTFISVLLSIYYMLETDLYKNKTYHVLTYSVAP